MDLKHHGAGKVVAMAPRKDLGKIYEVLILLRNRRIRRQLSPQAPLQLLTQLGNFHPSHYDELTAQHLSGLVIVRQLAGNSAVLAFLVPAESSVGNGFRADELETAQQ
jgi:hypothetical protein